LKKKGTGGSQDFTKKKKRGEGKRTPTDARVEGPNTTSPSVKDHGKENHKGWISVLQKKKKKKKDHTAPPWKRKTTTRNYEDRGKKKEKRKRGGRYLLRVKGEGRGWIPIPLPSRRGRKRANKTRGLSLQRGGSSLPHIQRGEGKEKGGQRSDPLQVKGGREMWSIVVILHSKNGKNNSAQIRIPGRKTCQALRNKGGKDSSRLVPSETGKSPANVMVGKNTDTLRTKLILKERAGSISREKPKQNRQMKHTIRKWGGGRKDEAVILPGEGSVTTPEEQRGPAEPFPPLSKEGRKVRNVKNPSRRRGGLFGQGREGPKSTF